MNLEKLRLILSWFMSFCVPVLLYEISGWQFAILFILCIIACELSRIGDRLNDLRSKW